MTNKSVIRISISINLREAAENEIKWTLQLNRDAIALSADQKRLMQLFMVFHAVGQWQRENCILILGGINFIERKEWQ